MEIDLSNTEDYVKLRNKTENSKFYQNQKSDLKWTVHALIN